MDGISIKATVDADLFKVDWSGPRWFGAKLGKATLRLWREEVKEPATSAVHVCLAQCFARDIKDDGLCFGVGVGQVELRHLFYIGASNGRPRLAVGFFWLTRDAQRITP